MRSRVYAIAALMACSVSITEAIARDYGKEFSSLDGCLEVLQDFAVQKKTFEGQYNQYKNQLVLVPEGAAAGFEAFLAIQEERIKIAEKIQRQLLAICDEYD